MAPLNRRRRRSQRFPWRKTPRSQARVSQAQFGPPSRALTLNKASTTSCWNSNKASVSGRENERADTALGDDLEIDESLEKKSVALDQRQSRLAAESAAATLRARRKELSSLPERREEAAYLDEDELAGAQRILTFESEIDPVLLSSAGQRTLCHVSQRLA